MKSEIKAKLSKLREFIYPGMLGAAELMKFYKVASEEEIKKFEGLMADHEEPKAFDLLGSVLRLTKGEIDKMKQYLASSLTRANKLLRSLKEGKASGYVWGTDLPEGTLEWLRETLEAGNTDSIEKLYVHWVSPNKDGKGFQMGVTFTLVDQDGNRKECVWEEIVIPYDKLLVKKEAASESQEKIEEQVGFSTQGRGSKEEWRGAGVKSTPQMLCKACKAKFFPSPKVKPVLCPACGSKDVAAIEK